MRASLSSIFKGPVRTQMLAQDAPFSEGAMGTDIHPYPEGSADSLMDVSQSNTYYMSAPAAGPYEYGGLEIHPGLLHFLVKSNLNSTDIFSCRLGQDPAICLV